MPPHSVGREPRIRPETRGCHVPRAEWDQRQRALALLVLRVLFPDLTDQGGSHPAEVVGDQPDARGTLCEGQYPGTG